MISVNIAGHRFQLCAAAVVVHGGFVLLHRFQGDAFWALPGGRVEPGEDGQTTVVCAMREELAVKVACAGLLYAVENFFEHASQANQAIGLYFRVQCEADFPLLDKPRDHVGVKGDQRLAFRWFPAALLHAVDLWPAFLRDTGAVA
ncbi:NUDIX hydrolase [Comamonas aquatica]|uniref:NUDIX hydrolase n=1 Tax=Comamonas aquatica TaxID=225991 RepID=UPI001B39379D|nr:NUDIX domain-containing protein [Comamonas aquatica]QTX21414.1 NUDIX domain-containing protein [Comamonas aquatica]